MRTIVLTAVLSTCVACASNASDGKGADDASATPDRQESATTREDVSFQSDLQLTGYLTTSPAAAPGSPGILLIHQFNRSDQQWGQWPEELAAKGYRVLAFNLRGHGDSAPYQGSLTGLLSDPDAAPKDVRAALTYLSTEGQADASRLAIVGTSIGANLSVEAAIAGLAKTYVSLSSRKSAVESLANAPATGMASVFYLASENDGGGTQAADAQAMFDITSVAQKLEIYAGVSDHGIALLENHPESYALIESWLAETLAR